MLTKLKKAAHFVGTALMLVALTWVGYRLVQEISGLESTYLSWETAIDIAVCALVYAIIQVLISAAWGTIYSGTSDHNARLMEVVNLYGRSHIVKYIPGNVLQLVQRQLIGARYGWSQASMAMASFLEIVLQVSACLILILLLGLHQIGDKLGVHNQLLPLFIIALVGVVVMWIMFFFAPLLPLVHRIIDPHRLKRLALGPSIPIALTLLLTFFVLKSSLFWYLGYRVGIEHSLENLDLIMASFLVAWVIGYLALGAPGGLGVREALIVLLLESTLGPAEAILLATMFRVVNVMGDIIYFLFALVIGGHYTRHQGSAEPL